MNKLRKVASRFAKILKRFSKTTPQLPTGYGAILNIYNAAKQMKNEIIKFQEDPSRNSSSGDTEPGVFPRVNSIFQNASKFLWVAAYKGITAATSARYHGLISEGLNNLIAYANNKKTLDENMLARNPYEANIYTTVLASSKNLSNALANFNPISMSAQIKPKAQTPAEAPYGSVESVPFGPPTAPTSTPKNMPAAYSGGTFDFGKFNPAKVPSGPARISNKPEEKLPLSEREQQLERWKTP